MSISQIIMFFGLDAVQLLRWIVYFVILYAAYILMVYLWKEGR